MKEHLNNRFMRLELGNSHQFSFLNWFPDPNILKSNQVSKIHFLLMVLTALLNCFLIWKWESYRLRYALHILSGNATRFETSTPCLLPKYLRRRSVPGEHLLSLTFARFISAHQESEFLYTRNPGTYFKNSFDSMESAQKLFSVGLRNKPD